MAPNHRAAAFTRRDLVVVIAVMIALWLLLAPAWHRASQKAARIHCLNNLVQIGAAYRTWADDHGNPYPSFASQTNGGWQNLLRGTDAGAYAWTNYVAIANEIGQSTQVLTCPSDERNPAESFTNLANTNISYFVGVGSNEIYPKSILGGDRNLGPGNTPDSEYGFSPADGKGNDVTLRRPVPVSWSRKMHSSAFPAGAGNILLADGSVQQVTSASINDWIKNALAAESANRKGTNVSALRLIFP